MYFRSIILALLPVFVVTASCQTQSLTPLITTNKPGDYKLPSAWGGMSRVTARSGFFTTKDGSKETGEQLRFDMLTLRNPTVASRFGSRFIWEDAGLAKEGRRMGHIHAYRASLPLDSELVAAHKLSSLTNLFGASHDPTDAWGDQLKIHSTAGWRFFSLGRTNTLETLSVFCMVVRRSGESDSDVDSIIVKRGIITPAKK
jgi:hypothetical protein